MKNKVIESAINEFNNYITNNTKQATDENVALYEHWLDFLYSVKDALKDAIPCDIGDVVYVVPSETNFRLNELKYSELNLNRVYEQEVCSIRSLKGNKYVLETCEGIQSAHSDSYNITWFLSEEKARQKLESLRNEWNLIKQKEENKN